MSAPDPFFFGPVKGPLTKGERKMHAFAGAILSIGVEFVLCYVITKGPVHWLGLYIVITMIVCAAVGYIAPRWLINVIGILLMWPLY